MLGLGLAAASRAVGKLDDEEASEAVEGSYNSAPYEILKNAHWI
jgi:hypothetical protein